MAVLFVVCFVVVVDGELTEMLFHRPKQQQQLNTIHWTGQDMLGQPQEYPMHVFLGGAGVLKERHDG